MKRYMNRVYFLGMLILSLACNGESDDPEGQNGKAAAAGTERIPVVTQAIVTGEVVDIVSATGTIFPVHDVLISSETAGTVTDIYCEVGQQVKKSQRLVQLDQELKQLAVDQAEAAFLQAKASRDKLSKDFERNKILFDSQDISEFVFENARLQKQGAEAAFLTANANLKMARRQLRDASITSPVNGLVAARLVEIGASVGPGSPIAKVIDIRKVKVKFGVAEKDVAKIANGQAAVITLDAIKDSFFAGTVTAVAPQADLSTRSFPVEIIVENPGHKIKAGMVAKVEVSTQTISNVPLLPKSALLERAGEIVIFIVNEGKAEKRIPQLGLETGDTIALLSGAVEGEEVVVIGQEKLAPGTEVMEKTRQAEVN